MHDINGRVLGRFGVRGNGDGRFASGSTDLGVDGLGRVYATDTGNHSVQVFDSRGQFLRRFGSDGVRQLRSGGSGPEDFSLPRGLAIDTLGHIYVADQGNDRVQRWRFCLCSSGSGDIDCDGILDRFDLSAMEQHFAGTPLSASELGFADVDGDGLVTESDVSIVRAELEAKTESRPSIRIGPGVEGFLIVEYFGGSLYRAEAVNGPFEKVSDAGGAFAIEDTVRTGYFLVK